MNEAAFANLKSLLHQRAWIPGIAAGMLTMSFGDALTRMVRGTEITGGEIALHVQCPWRIIQGEKIVVGLADYGAIEDEVEAISYMHEQLVVIFSDEPSVSNVEDRGAYAFRLELSNGVSVDVLPTQSFADESSEFWRVFRVGSNAPHFVAGPEGRG